MSLDLTKARILVVGDLMLDRYWHGSTSRISPEAPVPVVKVEAEDMRLGGAGNVALNVSALGARVHLLALTGDDEAAGTVEAMLTSKNVACWLQRVPGSRTISKLRILSRHQQLIRLDFEDHFPAWDTGSLLEAFTTRLADVDLVVLSDYAKGTLRSCNELIAAARARGVGVIVDPKGVDFSRYRGATLLTPNLAEFEAVVGRCENEDDIEKRGGEMMSRLDLAALLITRSEKGMTLLTHGREAMHLPAHAREVFDVTGAGDTVVATLATALAAGACLEDAVAMSNLAASIVVTKLGTAVVTPTEIDDALHGGRSPGARGVCSAHDLAERVERAKQAGERIVMTNGCFDILHPGHIDYLERARALGDRLIVAVNDDASVRRLKGNGRPINSLETRLRMLSALGCVDWVVPFSEDTPRDIICQLLPDVLVKGGDYTPDQIAGGECVREAGGEVRVLDFVNGHSTTGLIEQIRKHSA